MTLGQKIIKKLYHKITPEEAGEICDSLADLNRVGHWVEHHQWAYDVLRFYHVCPAHNVVQSAGWEAAARAYEYAIRNNIGQH